MNRSVLAALALFLAGCAHTYNIPEEERSRAYQADVDLVWDAALASVDDIGLALVESEQDVPVAFRCVPNASFQWHAETLGVSAARG